uniref:Transmembrane protein n=1 Tax=Acrobeloides nanus TaxID=290746 RepID=A0A914CYY8_9BILA
MFFYLKHETSTIYMSPDGDNVNQIDDPDVANIAYLFNFGVSIMTTSISLVFEISTAIKISKFIQTTVGYQQEQQQRKDIQLFLHSLIMFVIQCFLSAYFILYYIAISTGNRDLAKLVLFITLTFVEASFEMGSSIALFIVSNFFQDCCKHCVIVLEQNSVIQYPPETMSNPISQKRKRGRPPKVKARTSL